VTFDSLQSQHTSHLEREVNPKAHLGGTHGEGEKEEVAKTITENSKGKESEGTSLALASL
jgi:hypothetical protein